MSITTTSASCLSATPRATVAPTFPAPPTTVTLRFIPAPRSYEGNCRDRGQRKDFWLGFLPRKMFSAVCAVSAVAVSHVADDGVPEFRGLQLGRAVHEAREVVGDAFGGDGAVHALHDELRRLDPSEVPQHHLAGEDHGAGIHLVLVRVLRRRAVRRLEDR